MRKLASIRKIAGVRPIPEADAIECVTVDGWDIVTKKGEFSVNDLVVYLEIDSWVPHELAPFLSKGKEPREFNGVKGERLKTIKLRGQISQGLILPLSCLPHSLGFAFAASEGEEVTEWLGIQKWERPINPKLAGLAKGNFPDFIPKTDQERIQNCKHVLEDRQEQYEVTIKLDGSSFTAYHRDGVFGVCSRNLELKPSETNAFWQVANKYLLDITLPTMGNYAIQGELVGPGIQGNQEQLKELDLYVFDIFDIDAQTYLSAEERYKFVDELGLKHIPVVFVSSKAPATLEEVLKLAEGPSLNPKANREGLVFKSTRNPELSFKAISNSWLLKEK